MQATWGFVQVWLDVVSISSSLLFGFGSGLDVSNWLLVVIFITVFQSAFVPGLTFNECHTCTKPARCRLCGSGLLCEVSDILSISFRGKQITGYIVAIFSDTVFFGLTFSETGGFAFGLCLSRHWTESFQPVLFLTQIIKDRLYKAGLCFFAYTVLG